MGRKKSYDREGLIGKAMEIFRDHGFSGTSAEMLVQGLGVNRYSLYAGFVQRYFERLAQAFFAALNNAHGRGELRLSVEPRTEAGFFTASVLGMFVMLRAKAPPTVIKSAARVAIEHVESLRAAIRGAPSQGPSG